MAILSTCRSCKRADLPLDQFYRDLSYKSGHVPDCKKCYNYRHNHGANGAKRRERQRRYRQTLKGKAATKRDNKTRQPERKRRWILRNGGGSRIPLDVEPKNATEAEAMHREIMRRAARIRQASRTSTDESSSSSDKNRSGGGRPKR